MKSDLDIDVVFQERKEWAKHSLRPVSAADARAAVHKMFADNVTHPWFERIDSFLSSTKEDVLQRGEMPGGYSFFYIPGKNKGFWYKFGTRLEAIGVLGKRSLGILAELTQTR